MDLLDKLHEEHELAKSLLDKMMATEDASKRSALFTEFKTAIVKHSRAEEKVLYDAIKKLDDEEAQVDACEGYVEHHLVDYLVQALSRSRNKGNEDATAHIKVAKELLEHHIEEEESEVWDKARENFSEEAREQMCEAFEAEKKKVRV